MPAMNSGQCIAVFDRCIDDYHQVDSPSAPECNPYPSDSLEALLYSKAWIDAVQWHLEDQIRDPALDDSGIAGLKRRIDACNQRRNDTVEALDDFFLNHFRNVRPQSDARQNSETPAWLLDRLSILSLKLYHCRDLCAQDEREQRAVRMLAIAEEQRRDLARCLDELLEDIATGRRYMKVYRQLKMYNDHDFNPILRQSRQGAPRG